MGGGFNFQGGQLDPFGTLPGVTSPMLGNRYQQHWNNLLQKQYAQSIQDKQRLTYQELQKRRAELKRAQKEAREVGGKVAGMNFQQGVESVATAGDFGEFHQFHIREDVTLGRQRSAMLPVFQANIEGEKVSIYNAAVHKRHPLLAVKIKNTSGHPLPQGPVTIYDSKLYAGDSRLLNVQPDDSRILSYAMDLKTKVYRRYETVPGPEMTFRIGSSQFTARYKKIKTTTYVVKNTTAQPHTVILEHPISKELRLVKPNGMVKRSENNYRFEVTAKAKDSVTFKVVEEEFRLDPVALTKRDGQPYYSVASGIEVKPIKKLNEPVIVGVKTSKGLLQRKVRTRETTTYYIQNNSRIDRTFKIDHVIRPDWELVLGENKTKAGPAVERYVLKVEAGKTGVQNLIEDFHKWESGSAVDNIPQQVIRQLINLSVTSKEVKAALQKVLTLKKEEAAISQKLRIKEAELRDLSTEQTRRRSSLKVIPQNDPSYKAFLKRFIEQEQHIEQLLQEVLSLRLSEARKQEELESKLKGMTAQ